MNYLSRPANVDQPISRGDINFDVGVLNQLQTRYDANKAIVDQTIAQYESLRGLTDTDNEYIASQVSNIKNQLNSLGGLNLAHNTGRDSILNNMKNVLKDPIVQDILTSKHNKDAYDAEYQKIVEKDPSKASELNYSYGLYKGGYYDYINGKSKKVGSISYTQKGDPQKELKDIADNIEKYDTDIEKTWAEGGYIYTQKGKVISEDHLRKVAETFLTDGAKKQLVIDGWGSIHQGATEDERVANTNNAFEQYKTQKLSSEKSLLAKYEAQALKTNSEADKNNAKLARENYGAIEKSLNELSKSGSSEQKYGLIYKDSTLSSFSKAFAYNTVNITDVKGDTTFMAQAKMEYDRMKDERDYQLELKKAHLKTDKDGGLVGDESAFQTKSDFDAQPGEEGNVQKQAMDEIEGLNTAVTAEEERVFNSLSEEIQEAIEREVVESKGRKTKTSVLMEYAEGGQVFNEDAERLNKLSVERYVKQEAYNKHARAVDAETEKRLDTPELFKSLYNNPNVKMIWQGKDGKSHLYSAKEVLIANGMVNDKGEKIKNNPKVLTAIKNSLLADKAISETNSFSEKFEYIKQLATSMGEDVKQVVTFPKYVPGAPQQGKATFNPNTKVGRFLLEHERKGGYDKTFRTDSFDDISVVNSYLKEISPEEKNKRIGARIAEDKTVTFGRIVTVKPGTEEYEQIAQQAEFSEKGDVPIVIKKIPNQPNMVSISLGEGGTRKLKPTEELVEQQLKIDDLHPNILNQINLYNNKSKLNTNNFPDLHQKASYTDRAGGSVTALAEKFYGSNSKEAVDKASLTTRGGATSFYFTKFKNILGTEANPTKVGLAVKNMINSSENYIETQKTKEGSKTYIVPVLKKGDKTVFIPQAVGDNLITDDNADSVQKSIKFTPQDYFNNYLITVLKSQNENEMNKFIQIYGE
jgi:hypothetical protein